MKRAYIFVVLFVVLPAVVCAQVEKSVEVTKAYVPSVADASKLAIEPDMNDTVKMRPDIDYTIMPQMLTTTLATRPIKPATVTYWQFNRPNTFYVKAGVGYPANSVLDFYASSQNRSTGYVVGYLNHEGRYADIKNDFGEKSNSVRMTNRIGVAAGKYLGRRTLEGEVSYDNRLYHLYGLPISMHQDETNRVNYGDIGFKVRIGDDFTDLSRFNFNVDVHGSYFMAGSRRVVGDVDCNQLDLGVGVALARKFGHHTVSLKGGFDHSAGSKSISDYVNNIFYGGVKYAYDGHVTNLEFGVDYYRSNIKDVEPQNHVIPFFNLRLDFGIKGFSPFLELDGGLRDNSFRTLSKQNPYLMAGLHLPYNSVDCNVRLGFGGGDRNSKFSYRLYAGLTVSEDNPYWLIFNRDLIAVADRLMYASFCGEIEYHPIDRLGMSLAARGYIYEDRTFSDGRPTFDGEAKIWYNVSKVSFGVSATMQSTRYWSEITTGLSDDNKPTMTMTPYEVPFAVDLRAFVDWRITRGISIFADVRNLANMRLYDIPCYPEYGANFTAGVKLNF